MKAKLFERLGKKTVKCTACSHYCKIPEGGTGICGIRKNAKGELHLLTYGKPLGLQVDPIEKKPLYHFLPGSEILSFGTYGCNFACDFCQNWPSSQAPRLIKQSSKSDEKTMSTIEKALQEIEDVPPEDIVKAAKAKKAPSIAYTYNEPTVFFEYALDVARLAKKSRIRNVFVSNGFMSKELMDKAEDFIDAINIDLKSFSEDFYLKVCRGRLKPVLENIKAFHEMGVWVELTTLVIPGKNDSDEELGKIAEFIAGVDRSMPWHISAFHPDFRMADVPATSMDTLLRAFNIGARAGLEHIYIGNVGGGDHQNTYCPKCEKIVIERAYPVYANSFLKDGRCHSCGEAIKGVWK
ncbi:AmmeMemoRadiSam system radical SAM enzyme [Candidatus Micrarchaeota archaeon RBG_16_49_10]|nr:MAG: AmmeMemoRadiSam system radical SAM enzyme [Candidatus Micrarchaeota archaeon RBG_16_49_10]